MSDNILLDKEKIPDDALVKRHLGKVFSVIAAIRNYIAENVGDTREEWKYYGKKYGWNLKTFLKKRNLFFIIVCDKCFTIGFVFGEKAAAVIDESDISVSIKSELRAARKYAEGRGISVKVEDDFYLTDLKKLIKIKIEN